MKRNTDTTTLRGLLRQAHAARPAWHPTPAWRRSVMDTITGERPERFSQELDRLAPRFALAAAAITLACALAAVWMLGDLPDKLSIAFLNQILRIAPMNLWI